MVVGKRERDWYRAILLARVREEGVWLAVKGKVKKNEH